jgi:hypothetical protein
MILPAKVDKYGRIWSKCLKNKFPIDTEVTVCKTDNGYEVKAEIQNENDISVDKNDVATRLSENDLTQSQKFVTSKEKNTPVNMIVFGNSVNMQEIADRSVSLVVTSPPYFNAPFDYPDLFGSYDEFLSVISGFANELKRVLG